MAKYDQTLPSIANPVDSRAGELMIRAGQAEGVGIAEAGRAEALTIEVGGRAVASNIEALARGDSIATDVKGRATATAIEATGKAAGEGVGLRGKADAIDQNARTGLLSFLGTQTVEGYKGKLKAGTEKEIQDALSRLEGFGPKALEQQTKLDYLQTDEFASGVANQLAMLKEQSGGLDDAPELAKQFLKDIDRYSAAQTQGVLSRQEVLTRVAAAVKKYSAAMPGWASEFRKVGADLTGIDRVDTYGVHKALTAESAREKILLQRQTAQLELDKDIAKTYGVPLDRITPQMRDYHSMSKQSEVAAANAKRRIEMSNLTQEEADKAWGSEVIGRSVTAAVAGIGADIARLGALNSDPTKALESKQFGLELSGKLAITANSLEHSIMALTRPEPGKTALSMKAAQEHVKNIREVFNNYETAVKNIEGRNLFAGLVKQAEDKKNLLINSFMVANPHVALLNNLGVMSELFKASVALGSDAEFEKRFGKDLATSMASVRNMSSAHANLLGAVASGQPVSLPQIAVASPALAKVCAADLVCSVGEWAKDPAPTEQKQLAYSNTFAQLSKTLNPMVERDLDAAYVLLNKPETTKFMTQLPTTLRENALLPLALNLDNTIHSVYATVQQQISTFNDPKNNTFSAKGARLELVQNRITGSYEVKVTQPTMTVQGESLFNNNDPSKPAGYGPGASRFLTQVAPPVRSEYLDRAKDLTSKLNKQIQTYTMAAQTLAPEQGFTEQGVREKLLKAPPVETSVPRNTPPIDEGAGLVRPPRQTDRVRILEDELAAVKATLAKQTDPTVLGRINNDIKYLEQELAGVKKGVR